GCQGQSQPPVQLRRSASRPWDLTPLRQIAALLAVCPLSPVPFPPISVERGAFSGTLERATASSCWPYDCLLASSRSSFGRCSRPVRSRRSPSSRRHLCSTVACACACRRRGRRRGLPGPPWAGQTVRFEVPCPNLAMVGPLSDLALARLYRGSTPDPAPP